jgi:hypothetical protein
MNAAQPVQLLVRQQPDGTQEWDLRCPHGTVTTEEVTRRYSRAEILTAWARTCAIPAYRKGEVSDVVAGMIAIRELLGRLARERWQCDCDLEPFALLDSRPGSDRGAGRGRLS